MNPSNSLIHFSSPYVFIAGSYERDENNDSYCRFLGFELARYNIGIISAGGKPGLQVADSMDKALTDLNRYEPTKILTFYRRKTEEDYWKVRRIGCTIFIGKNTNEMRKEIFSKASVLIAIGGGNITREEILFAGEQGIPVIPIGMSGGVAFSTWNEYHIAHKFKQQDLFIKLNSENPFISVAGTIEILKSIFDLSL